MALKGQFRGSIPPYGYMRNPDDSHRLIPDPETSPIVKEMFQMAENGIKPYHIMTHLNENKVITPSAYRKQSEDVSKKWNTSTIMNILKNRQYCGHLISQKQTTQSFKSKKRIYRPESEWIIHENTHDKLVDEQTFEKVQALIKTKKRRNKSNIENIFAGLLKCSACGYGMCYSSTRKGEMSGFYLCNFYKKHSRSKSCTTHYITFAALYEIVLGEFQKLAVYVKDHKSDLGGFYNEVFTKSADSSERSQHQNLEKYCSRVRELDLIIKKMLEQNALGVLTDERFAALSSEYEIEQGELNVKIRKLKESQIQKSDSLKDMGAFCDVINKYTKITELTVPILHEFIEKIEIHQAEGSGKARTQRLDIYWRFTLR